MAVGSADGRFVLHPRGWAYICEETVIIGLLVVLCLLVPLAIAFDFRKGWIWTGIDLLSDTAFLVDPVFVCCLAFFSDEMDLVTDRQRIVQRYASNRVRLGLDMLAALPLLTMSHMFPSLAWFTTLKLCKAYRFGNARLWVELRNHPSLKRGLTFLLLGGCFVGSTHIAACVFFCVGKHNFEHGEESWIEATGIHGSEPPAQYLTALYWALATFTTVGYGEWVAQGGDGCYRIRFLSFFLSSLSLSLSPLLSLR